MIHILHKEGSGTEPGTVHTGDQLVPCVLRVRSSPASIDTVYVRMVRGQDVAY